MHILRLEINYYYRQKKVKIAIDNSESSRVSITERNGMVYDMVR